MLSTGEKEEAVKAYLTGVAAALTAFFVIGLHVGRRVRDTNDYYVAGRRAPVLLVTGSLIASFLSTGAFLGDTGEVYSGALLMNAGLCLFRMPNEDGYSKTFYFTQV